MTIYFTDENDQKNLCHKETGGNLYFTFGNSQFFFIFTDLFLKKKTITILFSFKL